MTIKTNNKATRSYCYETLDKEDIKTGFKQRELSPDEQMMSNEDNALFYDEVERKDKLTGKKVEGFLNRGNMLDRL